MYWSHKAVRFWYLYWWRKPTSECTYMSCLTGVTGLRCNGTFQCLPLISLKIKVLCLARDFFLPSLHACRKWFDTDIPASCWKQDTATSCKRIYRYLREASLSKCVEHSTGVCWNMFEQRHLISHLDTKITTACMTLKLLLISSWGAYRNAETFYNYLSAWEWLDIVWVFIFAQNVTLTCFLLTFHLTFQLSTTWMEKIWHRHI